MDWPYGEQVIILHPGAPTTDPDYGTTVPGEPVAEVVDKAAVAPGDTRENMVNQATSDVAFTIYLPPGFTVEHDAAMTVRGATYEVEGAGQEWRSPFTGWEPGSVVAVRRSQ